MLALVGIPDPETICGNCHINLSPELSFAWLEEMQVRHALRRGEPDTRRVAHLPLGERIERRAAAYYEALKTRDERGLFTAPER
jgi:hypothetical protein